MHESDPELTLALHNSMNRLKLAKDYCDLFDRLVDMSDIASFGDGPEEMTGIPGVIDPATAYSRSLIYPGATAFAYINEIELRQIRARARVFAQTNPYAIGAARNRMAYAVGSGHTYNVLPRERTPASDARRLPQGARGFPPAEQVEPAAEGDRPPPGPRRRAVPAAVRQQGAGRS